MKLLTVACLASAAIASAIPRQTSRFRLKTVEATKPEFNNLYVTPLHTGAGMNDAILNATTEITSSLDGSSLLFDLPTDLGVWNAVLNDAKYYASM